MEKSVFLSELKDALMLEDDEINDATEINLTSLAKLSVIAFVDENFNKRIKVNELRNISNVNDLIELIGKENIR